MNWLDAALTRASATNWTLILCASGASASLVRRHIAKRGGALGVMVATPTSLAAKWADTTIQQVEDEDIAPSPLKGPLWDRCLDRPGLERQLRDHVERAIRLGVSATGDQDFDVALASAPTASGSSRDLAGLILAAKSAGRAVLGDARFTQVFAIGFGEPGIGLPAGQSVDSSHQTLVDALSATRISAPVEHAESVDVPTILADDVVGEARWVAQQVANFREHGGQPDEVLVLVPAAADADRIRTALVRSGIPAADDGPRHLREHALGGLLFRMLPWFAEGAEPMLEGDDLRRLFQSRLLSHDWDSVKDEARAELLKRLRSFEANPTLGENAVFSMSRSSIPRVLQAAHLVRATIPAWIAALGKVESKPDSEGWKRRHARLIMERLQQLATIRQSGNTLGQLRAYLLQFGVKTWIGSGPDMVALAILSALGDAQKLPARNDTLDEALAGGTSAGTLHSGVILLPYDAYDGRSADLLLLTGLHAKGFGRVPEPDPFLEAETLAKIGIRSGEAALDHRERLLQAAVRRANRSAACAPQHAADGRRSSAYLALLAGEEPGKAPGVTLAIADKKQSIHSYGLPLVGCPEQEDLKAIVRVSQPPPAERPTDQSRAERLATQATVEWLREGAHVEGYRADPNMVEAARTLLDFQAIFLPAIPAWARPWMGDTTHALGDHARLPPDANLSVSSAFEPLTHCRYQAFAKLQLKLKELETLSEELDASEVGTAAHVALEGTGKSTQWRVTADQIPAAIAELTPILVAGIHSELGVLPAGTPALALARDGLTARWERHWDLYVKSRIEELDPDGDAQDFALGKIVQGVQAGTLLDEAEATCGEAWAIDKRRTKIRAWLKAAIPRLARGEDPTHDAKGGEISGNGWKILQPWLQLPTQTATLAAFATTYTAEFAKALPHFGPIFYGQPEWTFGVSRSNPSGTPRHTTIGGEPMQVNGAVDLIRATGTAVSWAAWVTDFKSWKSVKPKKEIADGLQEGRLIQIPLYAIILRKALDEGWGPPELPGQPSGWNIVYDGIRQPKKTDGLRSHRDGDGIVSLDAAESLIGESVRLARAGDWQAVPHPESCPKLKERGHDYCKFADVCRVRSLPGALTAQIVDESNEETE